MGPAGLREVAASRTPKRPTPRSASPPAWLPGDHPRPFFNELAVRTPHQGWRCSASWSTRSSWRGCRSAPTIPTWPTSCSWPSPNRTRAPRSIAWRGAAVDDADACRSEHGHQRSLSLIELSKVGHAWPQLPALDVPRGRRFRGSADTQRTAACPSSESSDVVRHSPTWRSELLDRLGLLPARLVHDEVQPARQ